MKLIDEFSCDINHPILNIIDSETRRHILQLIATENNYGNRLASILHLSSPAIHRHLKRLQHFNSQNQSIEILNAKKTTRNSFSGYRGAKATIYEIISNTGLFFGIFPNFIHSQVIDLDTNGKAILKRIDPDNYDPNLFGVKIQHSNRFGNADDSTKYSFDDDVDKINDINNEIRAYQNHIMKLLYEKNKLIGKIYYNLEKAKNLNFQERVVLKSLIAYGFNSIKLIAQLLNTDENDILITIKSLKTKKWIVDKKIENLNI